MPIAPIVMQPGMGTVRTASHKSVFKSKFGEMYLPGGKLIDGSKTADASNTGDVRRILAGKLFGMISSGGKWRPSVIGATTASYTSGATSLTVPAAVATEVARLITLAGASISLKIVGPPTAAGTVASTSTTCSAASGTTLTVTDLGVNKISGAFVCPADGAETPRTFLPDGFPLMVVDADGASVDVDFPAIPIGGVVDSAQIVDWPSDTSLRQWIVDSLTAAGFGNFTFDHKYEP